MTAKPLIGPQLHLQMRPSIPQFFGLGRWTKLTATVLPTRGIASGKNSSPQAYREFLCLWTFEIAKWKQYHFSFSFVTAKILARHTSVPWTKVTLRFVLHFAVSANITNGREFPSSISPGIENLQRWFYEGKNNKDNLVETVTANYIKQSSFQMTNETNRPFAAEQSFLRKPPNLNFICSTCPSASFALQFGDFCTTWSLSCKWRIVQLRLLRSVIGLKIARQFFQPMRSKANP